MVPVCPERQWGTSGRCSSQLSLLHPWEKHITTWETKDIVSLSKTSVISALRGDLRTHLKAHLKTTSLFKDPIAIIKI